jgi:hypothetical protein
MVQQASVMREQRRNVLAQRIVREFFRDFGTGNFEQAFALVDEQFYWFGRRINEEDWQNKRLREFVESHPMSAHKPRLLPENLVRVFAATIDGIAGGEIVILIDVTRDRTTTTACVVLGKNKESRLVIRRVLDPSDLKHQLRYLGAAAEAVAVR